MKTTLILFTIVLTSTICGCCQQKTTAQFTDPHGQPVVISCESSTFLKDMNGKYTVDPNGMALEVGGGSSSVIDAIMAGLGFLFGVSL